MLMMTKVMAVVTHHNLLELLLQSLDGVVVVVCLRVFDLGIHVALDLSAQTPVSQSGNQAHSANELSQKRYVMRSTTVPHPQDHGATLTSPRCYTHSTMVLHSQHHGGTLTAPWWYTHSTTVVHSQHHGATPSGPRCYTCTHIEEVSPL